MPPLVLHLLAAGDLAQPDALLDDADAEGGCQPCLSFGLGLDVGGLNLDQLGLLEA